MSTPPDDDTQGKQDPNAPPSAPPIEGGEESPGVPMPPAMDAVADAVPQPPGLPGAPEPPSPPSAPEAPSAPQAPSAAEAPIPASKKETPPQEKDEFEGLSNEEKKKKGEEKLKELNADIKKEEENKKSLQAQVTSLQNEVAKHQETLTDLQEKAAAKQKHYDIEKKRLDLASKQLPQNDPRRLTILAALEVEVARLKQEVALENKNVADVEQTITNTHKTIAETRDKVAASGKIIQGYKKNKEKIEKALGKKVTRSAAVPDQPDPSQAATPAAPDPDVLKNALKTALKSRRAVISGAVAPATKIPLDKGLIEKYVKLENFTQTMQGKYNPAQLYVLKQELFPPNRLEQNEGLKVIDDEKFLEKMSEALGKDKEFVNKIESVLKTKFDPNYTLPGIVAALDKKNKSVNQEKAKGLAAAPSDVPGDLTSGAPPMAPAIDAPPMAPPMAPAIDAPPMAPPMAPAIDAPPMAPAIDEPPMAPSAPDISAMAASLPTSAPKILSFGAKVKPLSETQLTNLQTELQRQGFPAAVTLDKNQDKESKITALKKILEMREAKKLKLTGESPAIANRINIVKADIEKTKNEINKIKVEIKKIKQDITLLEGQEQHKELVQTMRDHINALNKKLVKLEGDPDKKIEGSLQKKEKTKETYEKDKKKNEEDVSLVNSEIKHLKDELGKLGVKPVAARQAVQAAPKAQVDLKGLAKKYAEIENYSYDQTGKENAMVLLDLKDKLFGKEGVLVERVKVVRKEQDKLDDTGKVIGKVIVSESIPILNPETPGVAISDQEFSEKVNAAINLGRIKPEAMEAILADVLQVNLQMEKQKNPDFSAIDLLENVRTNKALEAKQAEEARKEAERKAAEPESREEPEKKIAKEGIKPAGTVQVKQAEATPEAVQEAAAVGVAKPEEIAIVVEPAPTVALDLAQELKPQQEAQAIHATSQTVQAESSQEALPKGRWDYLHEGETAEEKQQRELATERVRQASERMIREHDEAIERDLKAQAERQPAASASEDRTSVSQTKEAATPEPKVEKKLQAETPFILPPDVSPQAIAAKKQSLQQKEEETKSLHDRPLNIPDKLTLSQVEKEMKLREADKKIMTSQFDSMLADRIASREKLSNTKKILDVRFPKEHLVEKLEKYIDKYDPAKGGHKPQEKGIFKSDQVKKQEIATNVKNLLSGDTLAKAVVDNKLDDLLQEIQTAIKDNKKAHKGFSEGQLASILKEFESIVKNIKKEQEHTDKLKPPTPTGPKGGGGAI